MARSPRPNPALSEAQQADLSSYPRPSVAVDVAVLTVVPHQSMGNGDSDGSADGLTQANRGAAGRGGSSDDDDLALAVLLLRRAASPNQGDWGLPGSFVRERERLDDAVLRTLSEKCGIDGLDPRQLHVFDDPSRDDRGWVISVAHTDVVRIESLLAARSSRDDLALAPVLYPTSSDEPLAGLQAEAPSEAKTQPVPLDLPDGQEALPFDHAEIVALAVGDLRDRYRGAPDPAGLAGQSFTLLELRRVHEAVLGEPLQKDTFRRQMISALTELEGDGPRVGTVGRPARLYRRLATR